MAASRSGSLISTRNRRRSWSGTRSVSKISWSRSKKEGRVMSPDEDVGKTLGGWLGKAKKIAEPPAASETKGHLQQPERTHRGREDQLVQLNFKIPARMKKQIKQLAVRDNITLLTMLAEMVELYEKAHGK